MARVGPGRAADSIPRRMGGQSQSAPEAAGTPPAAVPGNDWTLLDPEPARRLGPAERVSVVIEPSRGADDEGLTVAALEAQAYPESLLEVIAPGERREPRGEIVVLLGAGTIPAPGLIAAHLRWHRVAADALSVSPLLPIDGSELDAGRAAAAARRLESELRPRRAGGADFDLAFELTAGLTERLGGLYCAAALGVAALRRETYLAAGGAADPSLSPALRRLDLAYRLAALGALLVPETSTGAWSVGAADERALLAAAANATAARRTTELEHPEAAAVVPLEPFRPSASARRYGRPAVVVNLDASEAAGEEVLAAIAAVLGGHHGDLELRVQLADGHPDRERIAAAIADDDRARVAPPSTETGCESPFQVVLPAAALPDPRTVADIHRLLVTEEVGALHVTVPGAPPDEAMITALASAALARSRRVATRSAEQPERALGRLFGERWVSGVEVGVRRHGVAEPHVTEHGPLAAATDLRHERARHLHFRDRANVLAERVAEQADAIAAHAFRAGRERYRAERLALHLRELDEGRARR